MNKTILFGIIATTFLVGTIAFPTNATSLTETGPDTGIFTSAIQPSAERGSIPSWVKNNAGYWADDQISDNDFLNGIDFMIEHNIIQVTYQVPKAEAEIIEIPQPTTFYVLESEWNESSGIFCEVGDMALSGGSRIMFGEMWAHNSYPIKSSEDLSYYDGWAFSFFGETKGFRNAELYVVCAGTNL